MKNEKENQEQVVRKLALDLEMHMKIRNNNNTFAKVNGINAIELKPGYCVAKMDVTPNHYNPLDTVHGGCIATLADVAASFAANSHGTWQTTLDSTFRYIRAGAGVKTLYATAKEVKAGRKISIYDVDVTDQDGKLIAKASISYMNLGEEIPKNQDENADFVVHKYDEAYGRK